MGSVWSYEDPSHMRLASREVCDDETWANTVLNRSASSVQERLYELESEDEWSESGSESEDEIRVSPRRTRKRLEFAETHMVRIFEVEEYVEEDNALVEFDSW